MAKSKKRKQNKKRNNVTDPAALFELGLKYYLEKDDPVLGLKYLKKAAKSGYNKAYGEIGLIFYREKNDPDEAERWFRKAEKAGSLEGSAAHEYGMLWYLEKRNWQTGLKYLLLSADQGCELAYGDIGIMLYLETDQTDEAEIWFEKAVDADCLLPPAAYYYGLILMVDRDKWSESLVYFRIAAEGGYDWAYGELGAIYYLEKRDMKEAEKWFVKAEEADSLTAPNAYQYGMFLIDEKDDIEKGNFYLDKAAEDGFE